MFAHFSGFSTKTAQHNNKQHTHAHAIDRYLARGLSKSICVNTRKTVKYAKQGKVKGNSDGGCGKVAKDQSNHLVADSLRSFSHFQEKAHD